MFSVVCIPPSVYPQGHPYVTITHDALNLTVSKLFQLAQMSIKAQNDSSNTFDCMGCSNNIQLNLLNSANSTKEFMHRIWISYRSLLSHLAP